MRILFSILCVSLIISSCTENKSENTQLSDFQGKYFFEECYGKTLSDNGICFEFNLEILKNNTGYWAKYKIDGNQTMRRFICDLIMKNQEIEITFNKYDEDDIHYSEQMKKGQKLLRILKKGEKYYASGFLSPLDGKIIDKEYELKKN